MGDLQDKIAIITGASRGLGAADARLFARHGARLLICDVLDDEGEALAIELRDGGADVRYHHLDVVDPAGWAQVASIAESIGGVDVLVNNAGIAGHRGGVMSYSLADWNNCFNVNVTGAFLGIQTIAPLIRKRGGGAIINVSSVGGIFGYHNVGYGTAKAAVIGLTRSVALDLVDWGIRVNAICPGITASPLAKGEAPESRDSAVAYADMVAKNTALESAKANFAFVAGMTPMERAGTAEEMAELVLFLASDRSSFMTGEHIANDGGLASGGLFRHIGRNIGVLNPETSQAGA